MERKGAITEIRDFPIPRQANGMLGESFRVAMPPYSQILSAKIVQGEPVLSAEVDPQATAVDHVFFLRRNGDPKSEGMVYCASFVWGPYAWHIYR